MQWGARAGAGSPGRTGCQLPGWVTEGDSFARALFLLGDLELTSLLGLASACLLRDLSLWGQWSWRDRLYPVSGPESLERA